MLNTVTNRLLTLSKFDFLLKISFAIIWSSFIKKSKMAMKCGIHPSSQLASLVIYTITQDQV